MGADSKDVLVGLAGRNFGFRDFYFGLVYGDVVATKNHIYCVFSLSLFNFMWSFTTLRHCGRALFRYNKKLGIVALFATVVILYKGANDGKEYPKNRDAHFPSYWVITIVPAIHDFIIVLADRFSEDLSKRGTPDGDIEMGEMGSSEVMEDPESVEDVLDLIEVEINIPPGPYSVPSCRLCEEKLYDPFKICTKTKQCGHTVCQKCSDKNKDVKRSADYGPCPYCKLIAIVNGKASKVDKEQAMNKIREAKVKKI